MALINMYQVYQLTDDGFEQSLGYALQCVMCQLNLKDADDALDEWSEWFWAYHNAEEMEKTFEVYQG